MKFISGLWSRGSVRQRVIGVGCAGLIACCGFVSVLTAIFPSAPRTPTPAATQALANTQAPAATATIEEIVLPTYTSAPASTATSRPTLPPAPTDTSAPAATATRVRITFTPAPLASSTAAAIVDTATPAPIAADTPTAEPPTSAPAAGLTVTEFTASVGVNADARLVLQTQPGAQCAITYRAPSGTISKAKGLGPITADGSGVCAWTWTIGPSTTPGIGSVSVSAGGASQTLAIEIK